MKALLFGSSGYVGSHLKKQLVLATWTVYEQNAIKKIRVDGDGEYKVLSVKGVNWNVDVVFICIGATGTAVSFDQFEKFIIGNEWNLLEILDGVRRSIYRPRVIFLSSRLVYRGSNLRIKENDLLEAKTVYAANKIACEKLIEAYSNAFNIPYTILRLGVPYGSIDFSSPSYGTIGNFISQAIKNKSITVYGDGKYVRTLTHIDDVCRFLLMVSNSLNCENMILNIPRSNAFQC
jgi:UDP-glucose 4-epimerase